MNIFKRILIRLYQKILYLFSLLLNFKEPLVISGKDSFNRLVEELKKNNFKHVFLATGKRIHSLKLDELLTKLLDNENIKYTLYFDFTTDPTIKQINDGANLYINNKCDCIVAIGGGSIMDGAKGIGIKVNNKKDLIKMKGLLRVKHKPPFNVLIPTTAGSGSEVSIAAVIINEDNKEKFPIEDLKLIPNVVALNPNLLVNLPTFITAYTGMDALTHAIEAYLGNSNTKESNKNALEAIKLIFNNLQTSYLNNNDLNAKNNMQIAAYKAGRAFSRAYVGYVHALSHAIGGYFNVPHGLANAILLPYVLLEYDKYAYKKLSKIYDYLYGENILTNKEKASSIINMIIKLNNDLSIPNKFEIKINEKDIDILIKRAIKESIPLYPVCKLFTYQNFKNIIIKAFN